MRLTVVGCSGSYPGPQSPASCYLVEHDGHSLVLDMGSGALGYLQRYVDVYSIDAIALTHLHTDHCMDLAAYYVTRRWRPGGPAPLLPVLGPPGTEQRMDGAYDLAPTPGGMATVFDFRDHAEATEIGPFRITTARMDHPGIAYAIRVEAGGRSLVYSGDTAPTDVLVELARGADFALFESAFLAAPDNPPGLHLTPAQAADHARRAGVDRLMLTHLVPWNDLALTRAQAIEAFGDSVLIAEPGAVVEV
ncbi:MAG: MBL fold metallo-hydrolase [Actinomycetes bacterium]